MPMYYKHVLYCGCVSVYVRVLRQVSAASYVSAARYVYYGYAYAYGYVCRCYTYSVSVLHYVPARR